MAIADRLGLDVFMDVTMPYRAVTVGEAKNAGIPGFDGYPDDMPVMVNMPDEPAQVVEPVVAEPEQIETSPVEAVEAIEPVEPAPVETETVEAEPVTAPVAEPVAEPVEQAQE